MSWRRVHCSMEARTIERATLTFAESGIISPSATSTGTATSSVASAAATEVFPTTSTSCESAFTPSLPTTSGVSTSTSYVAQNLDKFYIVRIESDGFSPFHGIMQPELNNVTAISCLTYWDEHVCLNYALNEVTPQLAERESFQLQMLDYGGIWCDAGGALHLAPHCDG